MFVFIVLFAVGQCMQASECACVCVVGVCVGQWTMSGLCDMCVG